MKNLIKISVLALAATTLMVSCQRETVIEEAPVSNTVRTFTLTFAQPDTKVAVTDAGKTTWEVGDEILVHAGENGNERVTVTLTANDISADGKKATIKVENLGPYDRSDAGVKSTYYAQYPASAVASGILYYESAFSVTNEKLMAACNVGDTFEFYNLCGLISYKVSGDFDKMAFMGNNDETVAYDVYQARVRDNGDGAEVTYWKPGNSYKNPSPLTTIEVNFTSDGDLVRYIGLPNGTSFGGGFTFKFYKGGELKKIATTKTAVNVEHGKILVLGDITSKLEDYVAPSTSDHTPADWATGATDLSNGGVAAANCYVVSAAGVYKLPALKGNSANPAGNVFGVDLLWETCNSTEDVTANSVIEAVDFDNDNLYFKTPSTLKPGNALIAAKDSEGKIIWSWHIWIPATAFTVDGFGISTKNIMSRNLGALVDTVVPGESETIDPRSIGLYYQWGRKDPFVGYKYGSSGIEIASSGKAGRNMTKSSAQITVVDAIASPTMFVAYKGDWLTEHNSLLWGNGADKTIYDPCPAGYRVPGYESSDNLWKKLTEVDGFEADKTRMYWKLGTAVFPMAGCFDYDGGITHPYDRFWLWNTKENSSNADYGEAQYLYDNSGTWASEPGWGKRKACGVNVRCVVE